MIIIRDFEKQDVNKLAQIYLNSRKETFYWIPHEQFNMNDFIADTEGESILVGISGRNIVGFVSIWTKDNFIHHLYVDKEYQGQGVGRELLKAGLRLINKPARLKCVVRNSNACEFYEKLGWILESSAEDDPLGPYHTYVLK